MAGVGAKIDELRQLLFEEPSNDEGLSDFSRSQWASRGCEWLNR